MKLVTLFRRGRETDGLRAELDFHLQQQIKENIAGGMDPDEAGFAALRLFGNPALLSEEAQRSWSWNWLENAWRDARYGLRTLLRSPSFSATAILVMALGIGASTSLFTVVRSVLLKPLPFREPDKLVMLYEHFRQDNQAPYNVVAPADFYDWREKTHGFQDMAAWQWWGCTITGDSGALPESLGAAAISWNLFSVLGIEPALGRAFTAEEDRPGANYVVILSWGLFQSRFGGDRSIIGKEVRIDSRPFTVVGVLPQWLTYPDPKVKVWVPYALTFMPDQLASHDRHQSYVVARLKKDVAPATAIQEVSALQYQLHLANLTKPVAEDAVMRPMIEDVVQDVKTPLLVLMASVGCMLLIACLNVSNLLVARGAARRKEVAIRGALGGSRLKLIREQVTESFLICIAGGTFGIMFSFSATRWLATHWKDLPRADTIQMDGAILFFAGVIVFFSALLAGLVPAISSTGKNLLFSLQESSRSVGGSTSRASLRKTLLGAEVTLTVVLLISAGLLFKSFMHLRSTDMGCATDRVLTMRFGIPDRQYDKPEKIVAFHDALMEKIRNLPDVIAAGLVSTPPGAGPGSDSVFTIPEHPTASKTLDMDAMTRKADPGYFNAMQIPLLQGRVFTPQDRLDRSNYVVISKMFADQFFPGESPLGKHVKIDWNKKNDPLEIIGVVGDTIHDIGEPIKPTLYFPVLSGVPSQTTLVTIVVRTAHDPLAMALPVQKQLSSLDPQIAVRVFTMQQIIGKATASQSFSASLVLAFALLSLMLAAIGLYGVLSYLVTQRIAEIGIRMALGAQRSEILRLVLLDGMRPLLFGLILGLLGGAVAGVLIKSILYGTRPLDPIVFAGMVCSLLLTAAVASAVPALRACRIEPTQALRTE
ncbi:MAG TPA: ABC transporter permease [Candidatus Angelobacter sp.]|nr:ABC transporter permease [Candidatus Angelobacter sp.]